MGKGKGNGEHPPEVPEDAWGLVWIHRCPYGPGERVLDWGKRHTGQSGSGDLEGRPWV